MTVVIWIFKYEKINQSQVIFSVQAYKKVWSVDFLT